jgi:hypothetical protein
VDADATGQHVLRVEPADTASRNSPKAASRLRQSLLRDHPVPHAATPLTRRKGQAEPVWLCPAEMLGSVPLPSRRLSERRRQAGFAAAGFAGRTRKIHLAGTDGAIKADVSRTATSRSPGSAGALL